MKALLQGAPAPMNGVGAHYELPPDKDAALRKAKRLAWLSIAFMVSIIAVIGAVMGASQTMKAIWVEDTLSLVPSISFLIGARYRKKRPNEEFPYGYRRAVLIGFFAGAIALFGFGIYILGDSVFKLVKAEHATIQSIEVFGTRVWLGWLMIAAMIYSVIPPLTLGQIKSKLGKELYDKVLHVSADLDKGDWLSGLAGVAGMLGIAYGLWWADGLAAAFISFEIVTDGWANLRNAVSQLMDRRPSDIESHAEDPAIDKVQDALAKLDWVKDARVRLREDGDVLTGEAFIVPRDGRDMLARMEQATPVANSREIDWRLHDVNIVPARSVD